MLGTLGRERGAPVLLFSAHPPHRRFAFQARSRLHQILKATLFHIIERAEFHVPDVFACAFQKTFRIIQRRAGVKPKRYVILAHHEKTKWILPLERRDSPRIDRFISAGHAFLHETSQPTHDSPEFRVFIQALFELLTFASFHGHSPFTEMSCAMSSRGWKRPSLTPETPLRLSPVRASTHSCSRFSSALHQALGSRKSARTRGACGNTQNIRPAFPAPANTICIRSPHKCLSPSARGPDTWSENRAPNTAAAPAPPAL